MSTCETCSGALDASGRCSLHGPWAVWPATAARMLERRRLDPVLAAQWLTCSGCGGKVRRGTTCPCGRVPARAPGRGLLSGAEARDMLDSRGPAPGDAEAALAWLRRRYLGP